MVLFLTPSINAGGFFYAIFLEVGNTHLPTGVYNEFRIWQHSSNMIENQDFQIVKDNVKTDGKGRLTLGTIAKAKSYRVLINELGQILLDPIVNIPQRELWIWQNSVARSSLEVGIKQASSGELHDLGSFAQYTDLFINNSFLY
jgi:hypothetical protein